MVWFSHPILVSMERKNRNYFTLKSLNRVNRIILILIKAAKLKWINKILNQDGNIVQSYHLPQQLKRHYTNADMVKFSRWYLEDYPVFSYVRGQQILVLGYPKKHSLAKFNFYANTQFIRNFLSLGLVFLGIILLLIFILLSRSKLRIKKEMDPIITAVTSLSQGQNIALNEKGNFSEIKTALNETSHILEESNTMKEQWIRGVSHDLRNPLMLISGYNSQLEQQYGKGKQTEEIENQIQTMKEMISNLNMSYLLDNQNFPILIWLLSYEQ